MRLGRRTLPRFVGEFLPFLYTLKVFSCACFYFSLRSLSLDSLGTRLRKKALSIFPTSHITFLSLKSLHPQTTDQLTDEPT